MFELIRESDTKMVLCRVNNVTLPYLALFSQKLIAATFFSPMFILEDEERL